LTVARGGHIFKIEPVFISDTAITPPGSPTITIYSPDPDDPGAPVHAPHAGPAPDAGEVRRALAGVIDPELHASIVDLGMVDDITVDTDGRVRVGVALTTAGCPLRTQIKRDVESKVRGLPGVSDVTVEYAEMNQEQKKAAMQRARWNAREQAAPTEVPSTTRVVAVASGKGGVGKSSVTVNLATALAARGLTVGVLDADIWGFSVPRMLGIEGRLGGSDGKITPHVLAVAGEHGENGELRVVSMGFLVDDEATALMWRGLILTKALEQFLTDVRWGDDLDYLLVDMPPGTGDIQLTLAQRVPVAGAVIVTTPQDIALADARKGLKMFEKVGIPILGVVENMSVHVCPKCGHESHIFGAGGAERMCRDYGTELLGQLPLDEAIRSQADSGKPTVVSEPDGPVAAIYRRIARRCAVKIAESQRDMTSKFPNIVVQNT
jgi:ATP-binding protein involved in chromosome partitioning